jgi:hypothetical protein
VDAPTEHEPHEKLAVSLGDWHAKGPPTAATSSRPMPRGGRDAWRERKPADAWLPLFDRTAHRTA